MRKGSRRRREDCRGVSEGLNNMHIQLRERLGLFQSTVIVWVREDI